MVSVAVIWTNRILPNLENTLEHEQKRQKATTSQKPLHMILQLDIILLSHTKWPTYALTNFMCNMKKTEE